MTSGTDTGVESEGGGLAASATTGCGLVDAAIGCVSAGVDGATGAEN